VGVILMIGPVVNVRIIQADFDAGYTILFM
jgi:hypothetical protein